jgi:predicted MFS family arabinose efflux permease
MIVLPQITPVKLWALMSSLVGMSFAFSYVLGPILGGVITHNSTWRWIYLFNAPAAVLGVGLILIAWPAQADRKNRLSTSLAQMDVVGALLLLVATVLLVFALQQAGSQEYAWSSPVIVATLVISGVSWVAFIAWIAWLESGRSGLRTKAIFPLSIAMKRPTGPGILSSLIVGFPFFMILINLPIRFQVVNNDSSVMAGIHTLPFLGGVALGTTLGGGIATRKNLTAHALIFATALTCLGSGLLSTTGDGLRIPKAQYGYQVILGTGFGLAFTSITMMMALAHDFDTVGTFTAFSPFLPPTHFLRKNTS